MHRYNAPNGTEDKAELNQIWELAVRFDTAASHFIIKDDELFNKFRNESTPDEHTTARALGERLEALSICDDKSLLVEAQMIDIRAGVVERVDQTLAQSFARAIGMDKPEIADLFKKYDLPALEELSRKAIKPPTP